MHLYYIELSICIHHVLPFKVAPCQRKTRQHLVGQLFARELHEEQRGRVSLTAQEIRTCIVFIDASHEHKTNILIGLTLECSLCAAASKKPVSSIRPNASLCM